MHGVFQRDADGGQRIVFFQIEGRASARLPRGLQGWASDLDALGGVLRLVAGQDRQGGLRRAIRRELASQTNVAAAFAAADAQAASPLEAEAEESARRWLRADSDWMLPPRRYC